jgi:acetoacetate decarboxylase
LREQMSADLVAPIHKSREITVAGKLDPDAFWPYADTIGGSRWPGDRGGPRLEL